MKSFVQRHAEKILGVLSGFDRVRFRGSLRLLSSVGGLAAWLQTAGLLVKDFFPFAEQLTKNLRRDVEQQAAAAGRPVQYLDRFVDKEALVQAIRQEQGPAEGGLVAALSTLEACRSYEACRNRSTHCVDLRRKQRKCLHYYLYFEDGRFGLTQVRVMSWFPFDVHVLLNGRE